MDSIMAEKMEILAPVSSPSLDFNDNEDLPTELSDSSDTHDEGGQGFGGGAGPSSSVLRAGKVPQVEAESQPARCTWKAVAVVETGCSACSGDRRPGPCPSPRSSENSSHFVPLLWPHARSGRSQAQCWWAWLVVCVPPWRRGRC